MTTRLRAQSRTAAFLHRGPASTEGVWGLGPHPLATSWESDQRHWAAGWSGRRRRGGGGAEKEEREYTGNTNAETASLPTKRTVNGLEMEGSGGIWRESKGGNRREVERSEGIWRELEGIGGRELEGSGEKWREVEGIGGNWGEGIGGKWGELEGSGGN